jgi:hypothetical protein
MTTVECGTTTIGTVRAMSSTRDPLALQLALGRWLASADLRPRRLAPEAILCIRRLRDPLPGQWRWAHADLRPPEAWAHALTDVLDQLAQSAARPALEAVPAGAEAVVFASPAEWMACLALDWASGAGEAVTHWWWRGLVKDQDMARAVMREWSDRPEYVPAALELVAGRNMAEAFVRAVPVAEATVMMHRVMARFDLRELQAAVAMMLHRPRAAQAGAAWAERGGHEPESLETSPGRVETASGPVEAPWRRWAPESEAVSLEPERQLLLGVGLALRRAPTEVRSTAFARQAARWVQVQVAASREVHQSDITPLITRVTQSSADNPANVAEISKQESVHVAEMPESQIESVARPTAAYHPRIEETVPARVPVQAEIETEFGGVFYLINLGLFLNLYGDFTRPLEPGLALPIWDFVALLGEQLVGERICGDAVWSWLARSAGRSVNEPPGETFDPPDEWRLSPDWLDAFGPPGEWTWSVTDGRLRVWHPAGFCLLDVRAHENVGEQLRQEMQPFTPEVRGQIGAVPPRLKPRAESARGDKSLSDSTLGPGDALARWLDWLMSCIRARLELALGLEGERDLARVVCEHPARIVATSTQLDVYFSLAELPIQIRLAGLDRDPGWVPAAGQFMAFHFD